MCVPDRNAFLHDPMRNEEILIIFHGEPEPFIQVIVWDNCRVGIKDKISNSTKKMCAFYYTLKKNTVKPARLKKKYYF